MVGLRDAQTPDGCRIYAIGDVHGCLDRLRSVRQWIDADIEAEPVAEWRIILIGDYIDRGSDSRGVIGWLAENLPDRRVRALVGNHDAMLIDFLEDPEAESFDTWVSNGGVQTFASYGVDPNLHMRASGLDRAGLHAELVAAMPNDHIGALGRLEMSVLAGDYLFVHAGIRPGTPIEQQTRMDVLWIRSPFLESEADHGPVVVHGHTPRPDIVVRSNRIGIDTGAVFGGPLTCLALEDGGRWVIGPEGRTVLPHEAAG